MATRDLTKEYLDIRASVIRKRNLKQSNGNNNSRYTSPLKDNGAGGIGGNTTPTNGYRKLAAGHDLMLSVNDEDHNTNHGYNDIEMNILNGGSNSNATATTKKPDWVIDVETVEHCITDITIQMKELQSRHAQRIGSVFGRDLQNMESIIEQQTATITEQFRIAERLLQKVGYATKRNGGQEATVGANIQRRYVEIYMYYICCVCVLIYIY
jgi:hypothetical protein